MKWKKQASVLHELQVIVNDFDADIKAIEALVMVIGVCFFVFIICHYIFLNIKFLYLRVTTFLPTNKDILWRKIVRLSCLLVKGE